MSNLAVTNTGDLDLSGGNLTVNYDLSSIVATKLMEEFKFIQGEFFADQNQGVPYFQLILVKNPNLAAIRQILTQVVTETEGVSELVNLNLNYDSAARQLTFSFACRLINGAVLTGGGQPFIVTVAQPGSF